MQPPIFDNSLFNKHQGFEALFDNAQVGLMYISGDRVLVKANTRLADIFGYSSSDEMIGLSMTTFHLSERNYREFSSKHFQSLVNGVKNNIEYQVRKKDGTPIWVSISGKALDDKIPADLTNGVLWSIQDITHQKETEHSALLKQKQISGIFNAAPIGMGFLRDRTFLEVNETLCELLGFTHDELVGKNAKIIYPSEEEYQRVADIKYPQMAATGKGSIETIMQRKDGRLIPVYLSSACLDPDDMSSGSTFTVIDLTELKDANKQLLLQASVLEQIQDHVTVTDLQGNILYVNESEAHKTGLSKNDLEGRNISFYGDNPDSDASQQEIIQKTLANGDWRGEVINFDNNGDKLVIDLRTSLVKDQKARPIALVGVGTDITQHKKTEQQIKYMAYFDVLTDLPNRELFADRLSQSYAQSKRSGKKLAICYLDLDDFKPINDRYGHSVGDKLLIDFCERLRHHIREKDTLARLGGDEFAILLNDLENITQCEEALQRLLKAINQPFVTEDQRLHISASIGATIFPNDNCNPEVLLRHADQAMCIAKEDGKNNFRLYDPAQDHQARAFRKLIKEFEQAILTSQLLLHYQPRVNLRTGEIESLEALVRWQHPEKGLLHPNDFLPGIEGNPLEIELDKWVIKTALEQHMEWRNQGAKLALSVNISPRHIQQSTFPEYLGQLLKNYPVDMADYLELEILETSAIGDTTHVAKIMQNCAELGIKFSLDDFGTGYSSLTYFSRLPINILKIDQHFVRAMLDNSQEQDIIEGIIRLAGVLKRPVVAEGVENIELGFMLTQMGCQFAQGYGIAKPMLGSLILNWYKKWQVEGLWHGLHKEARNQEMNYDLMVSVFSHRLWITKVKDYLESDLSTEKPILGSSDCQFARWYRGIGNARYGKRPSFPLVLTKHEEIHEFVERILSTKQTFNSLQIERHINELSTLVEDLFYLLKSLSQE